MIKPMSGFSLLLGFGIVLGLGWTVAQAGERYAEHIFNLGVAILFLSLVGSRGFYVCLNWDYYRLHLPDILWVWQGGFSGSGALLGGFLGVLLAAWYARFSPRGLADHYLPLLASLTVAGWLACWLAGCAYGAISHAWWALPARDEWGASEWRFPVQFVGAVLSAGVFAWLERQRALFRVPGLAASLGLLFTALILFGLSFLRADPMPRWSGLRLDAWGALAVIAISLCFGLFSFLSYRMERS